MPHCSVFLRLWDVVIQGFPLCHSQVSHLPTVMFLAQKETKYPTCPFKPRGKQHLYKKQGSSLISCGSLVTDFCFMNMFLKPCGLPYLSTVPLSTETSAQFSCSSNATTECPHKPREPSDLERSSSRTETTRGVTEQRLGWFLTYLSHKHITGLSIEAMELN